MAEFSLLEMLQAFFGLVLVLASGHFAANALFSEKELDWIEHWAIALALGLFLPPLLSMFANLVLGIRFDLLLVFATYFLVGGLGYFFSLEKTKKQVAAMAWKIPFLG